MISRMDEIKSSIRRVENVKYLDFNRQIKTVDCGEGIWRCKCE